MTTLRIFLAFRLFAFSSPSDWFQHRASFYFVLQWCSLLQHQVFLKSSTRGIYWPVALLDFCIVLLTQALQLSFCNFLFLRVRFRNGHNRYSSNSDRRFLSRPPLAQKFRFFLKRRKDLKCDLLTFWTISDEPEDEVGRDCVWPAHTRKQQLGLRQEH